MKLLLTSAGSRTRASTRHSSTCWASRLPTPSALCIPTATYGHPMAGPCQGLAFISGQAPRDPCSTWVGSPWACWSSPRCPASMKSAGCPGSRDRRPTGDWRRCLVPVPLDAAIRAGGPPSVAERDGLGGTERREHGDDPGSATTSSGGGRRPVTTARSDIVDFSICPHLAHEGLPGNSMAEAEHGRRASRVRHTRSTTTPPSRWSTAPSKSSQKGTGGCSPPAR